MGNYDRSSRKKTRGVMVLVILAILIIALLLAFFNNPEKQKQESPNDPVRTNIENSKIENIESQQVYKL